MIDDLNRYFESNQYNMMQINVNGIYLYYAVVSKTVNVILIFDMDQNPSMSVETFEHIKSQIAWKFITMNLKDIEFLSLLVGEDVQRMKRFCLDEDTNWIIDKEQRKLIIYENQATDYLNLREGITSVLEGAASGHTDHRERVSTVFSVCNTVIVLLNILVFVLLKLIFKEDYKINAYSYGALNAEWVLSGEFYRLFTYMFLHAGASHLINNMFILFYMGNYLEKIVGKVRYLIIYFLTGVIAGLTSMGYNYYADRDVISVGASGAVFGIVGALAYIILINKGKVENISRTQMLIFIFLSLYGGFTSQGIDNAAHIGGLLSGFLITALAYGKKNKDMQST